MILQQKWQSLMMGVFTVWIAAQKFIQNRSDESFLKSCRQSRKIIISLQLCDRSQQNLAQWCKMGHSGALIVKKINFLSGRQPMHLWDPFIQFLRWLPFAILGISNCNSCALQVYILQHPAKFHGDWSYRCRDITIFLCLDTEWQQNTISW